MSGRLKNTIELLITTPTLFLTDISKTCLDGFNTFTIGVMNVFTNPSSNNEGQKYPMKFKIRPLM